MMYEQDMSVSIQDISPTEAQTLLRTTAYEGQRQLRKNHIANIAEAMRRNSFPTTTQIIMANVRGKRYLIDGQHRLQAVIASGTTQAFVVTTKSLANYAAVQHEYALIDRGSRRTTGERLPFLADQFAFPQTDMTAIIAAIGALRTGLLRTIGGSSGTLQDDDLIAALDLYAPAAHRYRAVLQELPRFMRGALWRASTVAVGLLSYRYALPLSEQRGDPSVDEFWRGVAFDDGLTAVDPRKQVNRHLLITTISASGKAKAGGVIITPAYSARAIIAGFNAYMERRELRHLKVLDARAPVTMYGTPGDPTDWLH